MSKQSGPIPLDDFKRSLKTQLDRRVDDIFPMGLGSEVELSAGKMQTTTEELIVHMIGEVRDSMGLTSEENTRLRYVEAKWMRIGALISKIIPHIGGKDAPPVKVNTLRRFFQDFNEALDEYDKSGSKEKIFNGLGAEGENFPEILRGINNWALFEIGRDNVRAIFDANLMLPTIGYAQQINNWQIRQVLGPERFVEYVRRREMAISSISEKLEHR